MFGPRFAARNVRRWLSMIVWVSGLSAQTCLVLSPATINSDATASWSLSLYSAPGAEPAAIQWIFQYPPASVSRLTLDDGAALTAAGKTTICAGDASAHNCLAVGANTKTIGNGVIAKVTAVLTPGTTSASILVKNVLGASPAGHPIPISSSDPAGCKPSSNQKVSVRTELPGHNERLE
jgi:hypothetical protein